MQYVYKYVDDTSAVVYVGITNDMKKRIYQHTQDKLKDIDNPIVYYFPVRYRADADMLETYLINYYGTSKHYNVDKTNKGDFSFLDICDYLPWKRFCGEVDDTLDPFVVSDLLNINVVDTVEVEKEIVIEKEIYVDRDKGSEKFFRKADQDEFELITFMKDEISYEQQVVDELKKIANNYDTYVNMCRGECVPYDYVARGLLLHQRKLSLLIEMHPYCHVYPQWDVDMNFINCKDILYKKYFPQMVAVKNELYEHESELSEFWKNWKRKEEVMPNEKVTNT